MQKSQSWGKAVLKPEPGAEEFGPEDGEFDDPGEPSGAGAGAKGCRSSNLGHKTTVAMRVGRDGRKAIEIAASFSLVLSLVAHIEHI